MSEKVYNVLFVCTHNSARSIMAEGLLNSLGRGNFVAYSAGSHPAGQVNPVALKTLERLRIPTDGYRSKDWDEFARGGNAGKRIVRVRAHPGVLARVPVRCAFMHRR
jgi:arsenate reductase (thioredoxin)